MIGTIQTDMGDVRNNYSDFIHESVIIAALAAEDGGAGTGVSLLNSAVNIYPNAFHNAEMVSFKGDIYSGRIETPDKYADVDAINIYKFMTANSGNVVNTYANYHKEVNDGSINRAQEFLSAYGDGDIDKGKEKVRSIIERESVGTGMLDGKEALRKEFNLDIAALKDDVAGLKERSLEFRKDITDLNKRTENNTQKFLVFYNNPEAAEDPELLQQKYPLSILQVRADEIQPSLTHLDMKIVAKDTRDDEGKRYEQYFSVMTKEGITYTFDVDYKSPALATSHIIHAYFQLPAISPTISGEMADMTLTIYLYDYDDKDDLVDVGYEYQDSGSATYHSVTYHRDDYANPIVRHDLGEGYANRAEGFARMHHSKISAILSAEKIAELVEQGEMIKEILDQHIPEEKSTLYNYL